ncbi:MAG: hypothetical protein LAT55_11645 [Opitutales bacterium]|nr:hypothetical protein [Opitutales bacterium]
MKRAILLLRVRPFYVVLIIMESWERYKAMFENQPDWFFYIVTFLIALGFCVGVYRLFVFSKYLLWGIVAVVLLVMGIYYLGDTAGWSYFDN